MLRPDGVKEKRYCGFHDRNSHSINECRVFRMRIQKAIQEGHLKFVNKMKLDGNPFSSKHDWVFSQHSDC
jgi:hypothetical protein